MNKQLLRCGATLFIAFVCCLSLGYSQINVSISVTDPSCAGFTDGSAMATASGGSGTYIYQWNNGTFGQTISGLAAGSISVTVTDDQGATGTASATVNDPAVLEATIAQGGSLCSPTDAATVNPTGGTAPYTYAWDNGQTTATATGLGFGLACVFVTDASGCAIHVCEVLEEPLAVDAVAQDVLCPGGCDGVVIANPTGGTAPYTYLWDNGFTGAINDMLLPGTYCVTVTDANGCTATDCGTIGQPAPFTFSFDVTDPTCGVANGSVTVTAGGGTAPYSYNWNTGASGSTISNLADGTYTVTVTDGNGCTGSGDVTISGSDLQVDIDATSPACGVGNTGTATAVVTGGTGPFTYVWSNGSNGPTAGNLAPGMYDVTVTDAAGCTGTASTTITAGSNLQVTATATDELCEGDNNGSASVMVSGGQAPYTYDWSNGGTDPVIDNLSPGSYTVMVSDAAGCAGMATVTVAAASPFMCSVTVMNPISMTGAADGMLTAQFSGGVAPYSVLWSSGQTTQTIDNLGPGTYTATLTDGNGCTTTCSATLVDPVTILGKLGDFVWRDLNRDGQQDANEPGVRAVRVTLLDGQGNALGQQTTGADGSYCFEDLIPGDYQVRFEIRVGDDVFTTANSGNDDTDSDAVVSSPSHIGLSQVVTINSGDTILTVDAGVYDACIPVEPGSIEASEPEVCGVGADPGIINSTAPATSSGAFRYMWMINDQNDPNFGNWTIAPGVNDQASYDPGPISEDTYFARCVFGANCTVPVESNVVLITVGSEARAEISGPLSVCEDEVYTFTAVNPGGGARIEWDFGPNATPRTSTSASVNVSWGLFGQRDVQLKVTRNGCETFATQRVAISNCNMPRPFPITTNATSGGVVDVEWSMPEDLTPGVYRIERSIDGGLSYTDVGEVPVDVSSIRREYTFTDLTPKKGYNLYRVCRVLELGDTYFSQTEEATFLQDDVMIFAYPNPIVDHVVLERYELVNEDRTVELVDQSGRVLQTITFPAGQARMELNLDFAPKGQLFLRVLNAEGLVNSLELFKN